MRFARHGRRISALLAACLGVCACVHEGDAELLAVRAVGPDWIEPGTEIGLTGEGFPVGRRPRVRFQGHLHRPGRRPQAVDVQAQGRVVSAERITVVASRHLVDALGGRGTFEGRVRVELEGAPGLGMLSGSTPQVSLDFAQVGKAALRREMARARQARAWLRDIGLSLEEGPRAGGWEVARVAPDGSAAAAGLQPGDTLVWADGVRLRSLGDLAGPVGDASRGLRVARQGVHGLLELEVGDPTPRGHGPAAMAGWLTALLLLVAWWGPPGRALDAAAWSLARPLAHAGWPSPGRLAAPGFAAAVALGTAWFASGHGWLVWVAYVVADLGTQKHRAMATRWREGVAPLATAGAVLVARLCAEMGSSAATPPAPSLAGTVSAMHPLLLVSVAAAAACVYRAPAVPRTSGAAAAVVHALGAAWLMHLLRPGWGTIAGEALWIVPTGAALVAGLGSLAARRTPWSSRWQRLGAPFTVGVLCPLLAFGSLAAGMPDRSMGVLAPGMVAVGLSVPLLALYRGLRLRVRRACPRREPRPMLVLH